MRFWLHHAVYPLLALSILSIAFQYFYSVYQNSGYFNYELMQLHFGKPCGIKI